MLTSALITTCGTISFMCYPYFDSGAPFCSLLDAHKGGFFSVTPISDIENDIKSKQFYLPGMNLRIHNTLSSLLHHRNQHLSYSHILLKWCRASRGLYASCYIPTFHPIRPRCRYFSNIKYINLRPISNLLL